MDEPLLDGLRIAEQWVIDQELPSKLKHDLLNAVQCCIYLYCARPLVLMEAVAALMLVDEERKDG